MKSMKRVNIKCPYCGSQAFLRPASVVCGDRADDPNAKLYVCARYPFCNAYVAAHRDTHLPMGTLADPDLRHKRKAAHIALDRMMACGSMTRKQEDGNEYAILLGKRMPLRLGNRYRIFFRREDNGGQAAGLFPCFAAEDRFLGLEDMGEYHAVASSESDKENPRSV